MPIVLDIERTNPILQGNKDLGKLLPYCAYLIS